MSHIGKRIAVCRLIEKMEHHADYSKKIGMVNLSHYIEKDKEFKLAKIAGDNNGGKKNEI